MNARHKILRRWWAPGLMALAVLLGLQFGGAQETSAQAGCLTFGQARQQGLFARFNLRPAGAVKNEVEARTGGKVVSFMICRPGPVYQLTVLHPGGRVENVSVPAR